MSKPNRMGLPKIYAALVCGVWFLMVHSCHAHDYSTLYLNQGTPDNADGKTPHEKTPHATDKDYDNPENAKSKTPQDKTKHESSHKTPENTNSKTSHDRTKHESNHKTPHEKSKPKDSTPKCTAQDAAQDSATKDSKPQGAPQDPPAPGPHNSTPQEWVDAHNAIRQPEGVVLMHWNVSLAEYAENYVKKIAPNCKMEHSGGPYGECLFQGDGAATAKEIVDYWASEKKYYDVKSKKCAEGQDCGHYLQVVNPNSPSLGCAKAKCANDVWYHIDICSYTW